MDGIRTEQVRDLLAANRPRILELATEYGISNLRIFGSVARGDEQARDLDLLVTIDPGRSLLDFVAFSQAVSELLGVEVDLVSDRALSPYLSESILGEAVPV